MQIKFSLRFAMILIAICACFLPMVHGLFGFSDYRISKMQEKSYRDALPDLRKRQGAAQFVTEFERGAELASENAQQCWDAFTAARALVGLGLLSGGVAIALRLWYGPGISTNRRPAYYLFSVGSTLARVLLISFALAAVLYIAPFVYRQLFKLFIL